MQLYGSLTSPFVRHCRIALLETGLDCEFIETDFTASASQSPTQKVPFLKDGALTLTDSSAIIKYLREKSGGSFLEDIKEYELFCTANTLLDASVNTFLFERLDNITPASSQYLTRQQARVHSGLTSLNQLPLARELPLDDGHIRLACYLDWGLFRNRIDLVNFDNLLEFLNLARTWSVFTDTAPPAD